MNLLSFVDQGGRIDIESLSDIIDGNDYEVS